MATTSRNFRIEDKLWETVLETANDQGEPVAAFVSRALRAYVADPNATNAALATIRGAGR